MAATRFFCASISGKPGFYFQAVIKFRQFFLVVMHNAFSFRAWTYQRHISHKYIKKLRQLIQMKISQNTAYRGNTAVVF